MASIEVAHALQDVLLRFMFQGLNNTIAVHPSVGFEDWKYFSDNGSTANMTLTEGGLKVVPEDGVTKARCDFINALVRDPANGA